MALFTTRVELLNTSVADYAGLHAAMAGENFIRTITSDSGITYHLPFAEYNLEGNYSRAEVLQRAQRAVVSTGHPARILVSEAVGRTWSNLERLQ